MFLVWCLATAVFQGQYFCVCLALVTELVCAEFSCFSYFSTKCYFILPHLIVVISTYKNFKAVYVF